MWHRGATRLRRFPSGQGRRRGRRKTAMSRPLRFPRPEVAFPIESAGQGRRSSAHFPARTGRAVRDARAPSLAEECFIFKLPEQCSAKDFVLLWANRQHRFFRGHAATFEAREQMPDILQRKKLSGNCIGVAFLTELVFWQLKPRCFRLLKHHWTVRFIGTLAPPAP